MNPNFAMILDQLPLFAAVIGLGIRGWAATTWLKIKNGYPLETTWAQRSIRAATSNHGAHQAVTGENRSCEPSLAQSGPLETVERIVTDQPSRLAREIDGLTSTKGGTA